MQASIDGLHVTQKKFNCFIRDPLAESLKEQFAFCTQDLFQLQPQNFQEDLLGDTVVLAGPGNVKKRTKRQSTSIQWQVGKLVYVTTEVFLGVVVG